METSIESAAYGPSFYPKILALSFALLSIMLVIFPSQKGDKIKASIGENKTFWLGAILLVVYPLLIPLIGFVTTSIMYLLLSFFFLGEVNCKLIPKYLLIASIASFLIYYLFEKAFFVFLPHGFLF